MVLDLENLLFCYQDEGTLERGLTVLGRWIEAFEARGTLVTRLGICDRSLRRRIAFR